MPSVNQTNNRRVSAFQKIDRLLGTSITGIQERDNNIKIMKQVEKLADYLETHNKQSSAIPQRYLDAEKLAQEGATKADIVSALLGE